MIAPEWLFCKLCFLFTSTGWVSFIVLYLFLLINISAYRVALWINNDQYWSCPTPVQLGVSAFPSHRNCWNEHRCRTSMIFYEWHCSDLSISRVCKTFSERLPNLIIISHCIIVYLPQLRKIAYMWYLLISIIRAVVRCWWFTLAC